MKSSGLVIVGSGGFGREAAAAAAAGGYQGDILGFLDDDPAREGSTVAGLPVLGPVESIRQMPHADVVIATGRPDNYTSKTRIVTRLALPEDRYVALVHPQASLAPDTIVGRGSVVLAGVVSTAAVSIGRHVSVMPHVLMTHDVQIADYATITGGVCLAGGVRVGRGAYVGSGTLVRQGVELGEWCMTGMGSLILNDVPARRLWFGSPASERGPSPAADFDNGSHVTPTMRS